MASATETMRTISSLDQIKNPSASRTSRKMKHSRSSISVIAHSGSTTPTSISKYQGVIENNAKNEGERCDCGLDYYSRVLGPTADETILTGLQTVFDLLGRLKVCPEKELAHVEPERESHIYEIPERDTSAEAHSQTETKITVSAGFQVNPSMRSEMVQTSICPEMVSEILQTIGLTPEMVSEILQTSTFSSDSSLLSKNAKPDFYSTAIQTSKPDLIVEFVQTSNVLPTINESKDVFRDVPRGISQISEMGSPIQNLRTTKSPSASLTHSSHSKYSQSDSLNKNMQGRGSQADYHKPLLTQGSQVSIPVLSQKSQSDSITRNLQAKGLQSDSNTKTGMTRGSQSDAIERSGLNRGSQADTIGRPSITRGSQSDTNEKKLENRGSQSDEDKNKTGILSKDSNESLIPKTFAEGEAIKDKCKCCKCSSSLTSFKKEPSILKNSMKEPCICGKPKLKCKCAYLKQSNLTLGGDQPPPVEIRYAIARISIYKDFTTYEILRSTRKEPRKMPHSIEGIFVVKKKQ